jgi:hypothetical protein
MQLSADRNWIPIKSIQTHQTHQTQQKHTKEDVNLSQIAPINKMMKNATLIKQLLEAASKREKVLTNDKNWFILKEEK